MILKFGVVNKKIKKIYRVSKVNQHSVIGGIDKEILEVLTDDDKISTEINDTAAFEDLIYDGIAEINQLLLNLSVLSVRDRPPATPEINIKLPKIQMKSFTGDLLKWRSFWEQFQVAVHDVRQLSVINKFHYLKHWGLAGFVNCTQFYFFFERLCLLKAPFQAS